MKKYTWAAGAAVLGAVLAGISAKWRMGEILSGALWGAVLGFLMGLAAELKEETKDKK